MFRYWRSSLPFGGESSYPAAPLSSSSIASCKSRWDGAIVTCTSSDSTVNVTAFLIWNLTKPGDVIAEGRVRLEGVLPAPSARILYVYDLGDYWQHEIQLESAHAPEPGAIYPRVLAGGRSCPPEDCGGTGGYTNILEILLDPTHEEFEDMREWAGDFNAEVFSTDSVNKRLRRNRSLAIKE